MACRIKEWLRSLSLKEIICSLIVFLSLALFLILTFWSEHKIAGLIDQQAAVRWDEDGGSAQVSCFFAEHTEVEEYTILSYEKVLEQSLKEVLSAEEVSGEGGKRLFIDAYSSLGTITAVSEKGKLEANAVGIGGDFFLFHPLQLVSGGYFSGNDLMKDSIILDEDAAWQLFGSNDIAGKSVMIGDVPHFVAGVVKRQEGRFAKRAGLDKTVLYVSNESLAAYGECEGISVYEIAAPNPVKHFVYNNVKEKLGIKEEDMVVVENSSRYSVEALIPVLLDFGTRSMQNSAVKFPFWENIGRGWEDVKAVVLLLQILFLLIPGGIITVFLLIRWRNRTWTYKDILNTFIDTKEKMIRRAKGEKNKWEHF